ncbi:MAG: SurA N-terminal domain-containing protein [Bacteroidota bacterium]
MALISIVRKNSGVAVGLIVGILLLALLGGDFFRLGIDLSGRRRADVGKIAGQKISIQEYQAQIEQLRYRLPATTTESFLYEQAWKQLITERVYQKAYSVLGLQVGSEELVDMVQGDHVHPDLQMSFRNPTTQQFDKQLLVAHLRHLSRGPVEQQQQWRSFEHRLATARKQELFTQLMQQSAWVTSLEAQEKHKRMRTTLCVNCLYIPYHNYADEEIQVTPAMLKQYLEEHKEAYPTAECRSIRYIAFPIEPIAEDHQSFKEELAELKKAFEHAKDARVFAKINTDGQSSSSYLNLTPQQLPTVLKKRKLKKGYVAGPVQEGEWHKIYRVAKLPLAKNKNKVYEVAVIEKKLLPGDNACDQVFRKADYCASIIRSDAQLAEYAAQQALPVHTASVKPNDTQVGNLSQARVLVRWLYNEANIGKLSPAFEIGNAYIVAIMMGHTPRGTAPLHEVQEEVTLRVKNAYKARKLIAQLQQDTGIALAAQAKQYDGARFVEIDKLHFDDDTLQVTGMARKAVGAAFALQPGARTAVADEHGVIVVELVKVNIAPPEEDVATQRDDMIALAKLEQPNGILRALEELAHVQDHRYRFY